MPVRKGLRTLAESLREVAGLVENMDDLLGAVKFSDPPKRDVSSPDLLHDKTPSVLLPTEAAALHRLTKLIEDMRRGVRIELNTLLSLYYRMDVEPLFTLAMRKVIPYFQTVTGETLPQALDAFMNTGERQKREDLELLLKVGAAVDAVVEVPQGESQAGVIEKVQETALIRAINFGSLEAVKILVGAGAALEF
uniref:Uncharacterized protein n=1 Tax=Chromera velia CCMP2878 TaxID=1169474 RepID=A0A0G4EYK3_9ALVE|eukprot:Cvel_2550.t1-p1 / transcript=Cvel_2550.t1 / gene=Cvel_2550 / organism=Chromera_velia_CCMP2878 / gene_product=hypothetical protein / transcript_product=hypothetical protein / location=Cvel_scaffold100:125197-125775(-) / protein_length=193 / sequence_SO=supercontig / SO=protein_coding / is_pseudo=false